MNRPQSYQAFTSPGKTRKKQNDADAKENMWSSLLDSVASGKRLPEKKVLVLGGTSETQKDFLETLSSDSFSRKPQVRHRKQPPIANEFALGYTYHDVLDTDHEDTLARLSIYTLPEPSPSFAPLLHPLFTARAIPDTLLLVLLDWAEPWKWICQLKLWLRLLRGVFSSADLEASTTMEEIMREWQQRRRGGASYESGGGVGTGSESSIAIPLGPGEWDEALGLPLCVVCHNSDKMDLWERDLGWREEEFDYILQFLRTILLKHGASLVYTSNATPNSLPTLVHSMLGIQSSLKRQTLKHNVIDRDKVLIPPNWDSWGKIRVLREGFDVEAISSGWSQEIEYPAKSHNNDRSATTTVKTDIYPDMQGPLVSAYEEIISDPKKDSAAERSHVSDQGLELETLGMQEFLAGQFEIMEQLKAQEEQTEGKIDPKSKVGRPPLGVPGDTGNSNGSNRVNEHIGPVQFNIGGIQVDAEDMLKRLKDREREETPGREGIVPTTPEGKSQNEALANFFAGLMKKGGTNSPRQQVT